jgi:hypothetical protein
MKKIYVLVLLIGSIGIGASAQCIIDTSNTMFGISPPDSVAPPVVKGQPYDTVAQVYIPSSFSASLLTVTIYWVIIDTVTNFPTGITYAANPSNDTIYGGARQCILLSGTTEDTAGTYVLNFVGSIHLKAPPFFPNDTTLTFQELAGLASLAPGKIPTFGYTLHEVDLSANSNISNQLSSVLQVMPNPNNGQFDVKLNYNGELTGDMKVIDATGRVIYRQPVSARGLYTNSINLSNLSKGIYAVQISTPNGVATKLVSVE